MHTHPLAALHDDGSRSHCVEACFACAAACTTCADACLTEDDALDLRRCIRMCLDCAAVCVATGQVMGRLSETDPQLVDSLLRACATAGEVCGAECERHAHHHEHCRMCDLACRVCVRACREIFVATD
jgi:hypothetical protein